MAKPERYTTQQVIDAIERGYTCVGAGQLLGCSAVTVRNYANKYPTVKTALQGKRRELVDLAEMSLRRAIVNGEGWAVALTLKTLGKDDGYSERSQVELTGKDGGPIQTEHTEKHDLSKLTSDQLRELRELLAKTAPGNATDGTAGAG